MHPHVCNACLNEASIFHIVLKENKSLMRPTNLVESIISISVLLNLGGLLYFIGFLVRDELILRILILSGTTLYLIYYLFFPTGPLWNAFITSSILGMANLWVLGKIVFERTTLALSENEKRLYKCFETLTPGQFRLLIKHAKWHSAQEEIQLCTQGEQANKLYYILDGSISITKNGKNFSLEENNFLGEVAFILDDKYSASAYANKGTFFIEWNNQIIKKMMSKNANLHNAIIALFNKDLALKVSSSYK